MTKCKIDIEENSECTMCCKECENTCEKKCIFAKFNRHWDCGNQVKESEE